MPFPDLSPSDAPVSESAADAIVLALPPLEGAEGALEGWPGLAEALAAVGFTGAVGGFARVYAPESTRRPLAVVGTGADPDAAAVRSAAGVALRTLTGFETVAIAAPAAPAAWEALAEGAALGGYRFEGYKTTAGPQRARHVIVHAEGADEDGLRRVRASASAVALVKDLSAMPADVLGPAELAERAIDAVAGLPVEVTVLDEDALAEGGFGGILGVGRGSARPPRLVRLDYAPEGAERHVALVGKGITFDTGGLSLKPPAGMVGMKYDMCGAAVALAVLRAAAARALPVRVTAWMCIADNMPSGSATRPGDVLRIVDGTTVEVLNTDAEGRLVLADGLAAASREHPDLLVDIATLTGAISVALGTRHAGVFGDDESAAEFLDAAARTGEDAWRLPLAAHMEDELDSPIADLVNAKVGDPAGGSIFAALFLRRFVGRVGDAEGAPRLPWLHLDIAGVGWNKGGPHGFTDKGPTGATVRTLIALLEGPGR